MNIRLIFDPPRRGFGMVAVALTPEENCGVRFDYSRRIEGYDLDSNIHSSYIRP
jgi:hypothetical protein